jgi:membrane protein DedA with SNARE-associated domain
MAGLEQYLLHLLYGVPFPFLIPLAGALAGGEETIITICILSITTGIVSFPTVVVWSFIGVTIKDSAVFLFGRRFITFIETKGHMRAKLHTIGIFANQVTHGNYFLALFISKFIYGMRIITILYLGKERVTFPRFSSYNVPVTVLWTAVTCTIGWVAGRGFASATHVLGDVTYIVSVLAFVAVGLYVLRLWLNKEIIEEENLS